jgi:hypothetical protein
MQSLLFFPKLNIDIVCGTLGKNFLKSLDHMLILMTLRVPYILLHDNAWLHGLHMEKTFWVPAYMKDTFWTGMNTMQQSESMNAFLDGCVHS